MIPKMVPDLNYIDVELKICNAKIVMFHESKVEISRFCKIRANFLAR